MRRVLVRKSRELRWDCEATVGAFGLTLAMLPIAKAVAQTAGRVVMAVGDVTVQRTNDRVKLAQGGEVRVGDRVITGPQSHAQLRFSDEALVALRPDSEFQIDGYSFQSPGQRTRACSISAGQRWLPHRDRTDRPHQSRPVPSPDVASDDRHSRHALRTNDVRADQCRRANGSQPRPECTALSSTGGLR